CGERRCAPRRGSAGTPPADRSCHGDLGLSAEITPLAPAALHAPPARDPLRQERRRALGARLRHRALPQHELAVGVRRAAEERPPLARAPLDQLPLLALRTGDAERDGLSRLALRVPGARDELAEAAVLDDHRAATGGARLVGGLVLGSLAAGQVAL